MKKSENWIFLQFFIKFSNWEKSGFFFLYLALFCYFVFKINPIIFYNIASSCSELTAQPPAPFLLCPYNNLLILTLSLNLDVYLTLIKWIFPSSPPHLQSHLAVLSSCFLILSFHNGRLKNCLLPWNFMKIPILNIYLSCYYTCFLLSWSLLFFSRILSHYYQDQGDGM